MRFRSEMHAPNVSLMLVVGILVVSLTVIMSKLLTGRSNRGLCRRFDSWSNRLSSVCVASWRCA